MLNLRLVTGFVFVLVLTVVRLVLSDPNFFGLKGLIRGVLLLPHSGHMNIAGFTR